MKEELFIIILLFALQLERGSTRNTFEKDIYENEAGNLPSKHEKLAEKSLILRHIQKIQQYDSKNNETQTTVGLNETQTTVGLNETQTTVGLNETQTTVGLNETLTTVGLNETQTTVPTEANQTVVTTSSKPSVPPPKPKSCREENVGIKIAGIKKKEFEDVGNDNSHHKNKLKDALANGIKAYCNSGKKCPNGVDNIGSDNMRYSSNVTEEKNDLFVDICVSRSNFRFGNSNSLFERNQLITVLKSSEARKVIAEQYKPSVSVERPPAKSKGLKGWQIALIVIGSVIFVSLIVGAIFYSRRKNRERKELGTELSNYNY